MNYNKKRYIFFPLQNYWNATSPCKQTCGFNRFHRNTVHSRIEKSVLFVCGRNGLFIVITTGRWGFEDPLKTYSHLFMLFQKISLLSDGCAFISTQSRPSSICVSSKAWAFHQRDSICFFSFVRSVFYLSPVSSDGVRSVGYDWAMLSAKCRLEWHRGLGRES